MTAKLKSDENIINDFNYSPLDSYIDSPKPSPR